MELTFVHQYSGDSPKRRRLAKACESCRARKKRCVHFAKANGADLSRKRKSISSDNTADDRRVNEEAGSTHLQPGSQSFPNDNFSELPDGPQTVPGAQEIASPSSVANRPKFVSDLNPESALLNRPLATTDSTQRQPNDDIGVWVDRKEWDALVRQRNGAVNSSDQTLVLNRGFQYNQRPHSAVLGSLIDVYFKKIHPILPILDEDEFRTNHVGGVVPEPLVHAMCLVAAKDAEAEPYLKLSDSPATIPPRQFCSILHASVTGALRVPVRFEKLTLIRILALTSLHVEGPEGAEEASIWLSQAMHYGQTLGIHLGQHSGPSTGNDLVTKRLFWCLWILDRTNAATNGRPIVMSDMDIAIEDFESGESGFPAFEAWLKIAQILNKVIDFYRPTTDVTTSGWEGEYPTLEEIIDEVHGWQLSASALATIHLFWLTVGVLSHRSRGVKELICGKHSHLRQRLFAIEIVRLLNATGSPTLHPLPVLPYAISLALSVSYQYLRQSQFEHQQADARNDFRTCCRIIQNFRRTWSSADVMATLAKKVWKELDRAPDLASFRIRRPKHGLSGVTIPDQHLIPPPTACQFTSDGKDSTAPNAGQQSSDAISEPITDQQPVPDGVNLFDNMDDVFGTFMDPNYPFNLDDMSFVDDLTPFDWDAEIAAGS